MFAVAHHQCWDCDTSWMVRAQPTQCPKCYRTYYSAPTWLKGPDADGRFHVSIQQPEGE